MYINEQSMGPILQFSAKWITQLFWALLTNWLVTFYTDVRSISVEGHKLPFHFFGSSQDTELLGAGETWCY